MSNISFSSGYGEYTSGEFFNTAYFELRSNDFPIFSREFEANSDSFINLDDDYFIFTENNFITGEELSYSFNFEETNTPIGIATTVISGISTDILPETFYAVKIGLSKVKVAISKTDALLTEPKVLDLTSYGTGIHKISSKNQNKNTLITVNNIIQNPIVSTSLTTHIKESITDSDISVIVNDSSEFKGNDLIKIDNEILRILSVGIGTTNNISFERAILGTNPESHLMNSKVTQIVGNYNIIDNFIYFTQSPYGNIFDDKSNLKNNSTFSGRVFLRSGIENTDIGPYDKNYIFDNISNSFDGKTDDFLLTVDNNNITGISSDNVIMTINDVFQPPSRLTGNVINGAYVLSENVGISSITFTGNLNYPEYDVNISELPRGGIIFSVGSTEGFGYQPLISAGGTAIVSLAGTIQSISIGYSGSGYRAGIQTVRVGVALSDVVTSNVEMVGIASISNGIIVGISITNPGSGYTSTNPPIVIFDSPLPYNKIPLIYSGNTSGLGTGAKIDIVVGQGSSIIEFNISNLGYGYQKNDILTIPIGGNIGIPTDKNKPFNEFKILVDKIYTDNSYIRTIGKLVIFDPIDNLFNGVRRTFPLRLNGKQTAILAKVGSTVNVENNILIFINDVLQVPGEAYTFKGGSILTFLEAPKVGEKTTILFYAGTDQVDALDTSVFETIKEGDTVEIFDNFDRYNDQSIRTVNEIISVDVIKTNLYGKQGISDSDEIRPIKWCPQNVDKFISGSGSTVTSVVTKDRVIYEPLIYPTAYLIKDFNIEDTEIFVDNAKTFFDNINESPITNDITIISQKTQVSASLTAIVSSAGTIQSVDIINPGLGYLNDPIITIASPIGVGTTAIIISNLNSNGQINSVSIVNSGFGYTNTNPPYIIVEEPRQNINKITEVSYTGDFGIISGIGTTIVSGSKVVIFDFYIPKDSYIRNSDINNVGAALTGISGISTGYYFQVSNSNIGNSIISLKQDNSIIGIGTTFIDNVYQVLSYSIKQKPVLGIGITYVNEVYVKVENNDSLIGIAGSGYYGDYSWARIFDLDNRIGINTFYAYVPGITTSTIIQRSNSLKYFNYLK